MNEHTIAEFLKENAAKDLVSFHMPGHKGRSELYDEAGYGALLRSAAAFDITEVPGADSLYDPKSTIKAVMDNYAELYDVLHTELLVNGSSAGIIAAILSNVPIGGKLILSRASHHAAFSALRLGGINPVYISPETDPDFNITAGISPYDLEAACEANPDASAVLITSPNYCGMLSDISVLADIAHDHGMVVIVDQAHGAHLKFFDYDAEQLRKDGAYIPHAKHAAESLGADIVINSTHKTLLSFTGSAIMNVCGDSIDIDALKDALRMLQTTSPSYLLMASLDINERIMRKRGSEIVRSWKSDITDFYRRASKISGLTLVSRAAAPAPPADGAAAAAEDPFALYKYREGIDPTKINLSFAGLGLSGERLEKELRYSGIVGEMVHGEYLLLMSGAGNVKSDYERLLEALTNISSNYGIGSAVDRTPRSFDAPLPESSFVPTTYEQVPLYESEGRIVYEPVVAYPPGTPIICPGEIMSLEVISYITKLLESDADIVGVDDEGMIKAGTDC